MNPATRTLSVGALTRVEGEGAVHVKLRDGALDSVELNIYEPPRFFEAFLRGRAYTEPPDITARVCGICPVAYQVSACNAIEDACGVELERSLVQLRRLLYCGEWIHSHVLQSTCCMRRTSLAIRTRSAWRETSGIPSNAAWR